MTLLARICSLWQVRSASHAPDVACPRGLAKLVVALARGKKQYDKRAAIRDREDKRRLERAMRF